MKIKTTEELQMKHIKIKDEELEMLIRQLVKKAKVKKVPIIAIKRAIDFVSKEEKSNLQVNIKMSQEEKTFCEKVEKFLDYFRQGIMEEQNRIRKLHGKSGIERAAFEKDGYCYKKYYKILCSIYAVFKRNDAVNQNNIINFARNCFDNFRYTSISEELKILQSFFYSAIYFSANDFPQYRRYQLYGNHSLLRNEEFKSFCAKYDYRKTMTNDIALVTVWFIEKYF